jgi:hypothetical protein
MVIDNACLHKFGKFAKQIGQDPYTSFQLDRQVEYVLPIYAMGMFYHYSL